MKQKRPVLAIDIGGTKIIAALIRDGNVKLDEERSPTLAHEGVQPVTRRLFSSIDRLLQRNKLGPVELGGISIAAAGGIDTRRGLVTFSPNLPGWHDVPLRDMVHKRYGTATFILNDASAAALGEHRFGAGRGTKDLILLTLGTGIGGGIIIDGELYGGAVGAAGELGHMVIAVDGPACACGNRGCLEALASGTAIAREAVSRIREGESSSLIDMVDGKIETITAEKVGAAARKGDVLAMAVIGGAATYLGVGLTNLVNIFNPEMIVIGGGMSEMDDLLLGPAIRVAAEKAFPISFEVVRIVKAELGNEAGIYGAAAYALEEKR